MDDLAPCFVGTARGATLRQGGRRGLARGHGPCPSVSSCQGEDDGNIYPVRVCRVDIALSRVVHRGAQVEVHAFTVNGKLADETDFERGRPVDGTVQVSVGGGARPGSDVSLFQVYRFQPLR